MREAAYLKELITVTDLISKHCIRLMSWARFASLLFLDPQNRSFGYKRWLMLLNRTLVSLKVGMIS